MNYGDRIKKLRTDFGLSQNELANLINISRPSITKYERNEREPKYSVLLKMAEFFGVSVDYISGKTEQTELHSVSDYRLDNALEKVTTFFSDSTPELYQDLTHEEANAIKSMFTEHLSLISKHDLYSVDMVYISNIFNRAIRKYHDDLYFTLLENVKKTDSKDIPLEIMKTFNSYYNQVFEVMKFCIDYIFKITLEDYFSEIKKVDSINEIMNMYGTNKKRSGSSVD